jgi:hypothetical protein
VDGRFTQGWIFSQVPAHIFLLGPADLHFEVWGQGISQDSQKFLVAGRKLSLESLARLKSQIENRSSIKMVVKKFYRRANVKCGLWLCRCDLFRLRG